MYSNLRKSFRSRRFASDDGEADHEPETANFARLRLSPDELADKPYATRRSSAPARDHFKPTLTATPTNLSAFSTTSARSRDSRNEPLGLHVLHEPEKHHAIDIVFIHGLGGTCRFAWSHDKDLSLFWPKAWLPIEPGFKEARIMTFGYNAFFKSGDKDVFNISDFAKDLLLQMKFANSEEGEALNIGKVPIIFVCHSMGGLVAKKAYILGSQDPQYRDIIESVRSIVFLATPHRGANLAEILNKLLSATLHSPKQYISDLQKSSARITDINDQFKLYQEKVQLVSFFETQPSPIGFSRKAIVVERDSAILDYPHEISSPLNANHSTVSKFVSRTDANYVSVRNVLKTLVETFKTQTKTQLQRVGTFDSMADRESLKSMVAVDKLMNRLGVAPRPDDTLDSLWENYIWGSCDWALEDIHFNNFFTDETLKPTILHVSGRPGSGKSMLASYFIKHLYDLDYPVQFWYFRHDDQLKRSNRHCLLSMVFQMMECSMEYSRKVLSLGQDINSIARSDTRTLWGKLIVQLLDKLGGQVQTPLYWVIDALDESESPQVLLGLFATLKTLRFPLRIIFITRSQTVIKPLARLQNSFPTDRLSSMTISTPRDSLALYIDDKLAATPWEDDIKDWITSRLLEKSQDSYLWLSLVMRELVCCDTKEQLEEVLDETPEELFDMYHRLEQAVAKELKPVDTPLVRAIFSWVTCAKRQLNEEELKEALTPNFSMLNLKHTTSRLCGDFVSIDKKGKFSMIHYTAKEFLLKSATILAVNPEEAHTLIFNKCFSVLIEPRFRIRLKSQGCTGFLRYCCLSWAHHLDKSDISEYGFEFVERLATFFTSAACLAWIGAVATAGQLQVLTSTARILVSFLGKFRRLSADMNPMEQPLEQIELLQSWSTDLIRIVGKFGSYLLQHPSCIYTLVPLFCPPTTMISQLFAPTGAMMPKVTGMGSPTWDDSLAKLSLGHEQRPKVVICHDASFAIVTSEKTVNMYGSSTFQQTGTLKHNETLVAAQYNLEGTMIASCGVRTVKIWDTLSGRELHSWPNPERMRAMAVTFSRDSSEVIIVCVDGNLRRQNLSESDGWVHVPWQVFAEPTLGRGGATPDSIAFSPDGSQVAISHRTRPITVWDTETGIRIGRTHGRTGQQATRKDNVDYAIRLSWSAGTTEYVVGIFTDGILFKWYPMDSYCEVMNHSLGATEIACSPDGRLIVTAQRDGSLSIMNFDNFAVMYHLNCAVRAHYVAFSPDGRRIFDLRQSFCNVWEPNVLLRMAEQDEKASDTASSHRESSISYSLASEATAVMLEPVTTLCADPSSTAFAFGTNGGMVKYCPADSPDLVDIKISSLKITWLVMSNDGASIAVATTANKVTVKTTPQLGGPGSQTVFETKCDSRIRRLLFSADGKHILIDCVAALELWSLESKTRVLQRENKGDLDAREFNLHPATNDAFLAFDSAGIEIISISGGVFSCAWRLEDELLEDFIRSHDLSLPGQQISGEANAQNTSAGWSVRRLLASQWGYHVLLELAHSETEADTEQDPSVFVLLDMSPLATPVREASSLTIRGRGLPNQVESLLNIPIGLIPNEAEIRRGSQDPNFTRRESQDPSAGLAVSEERCLLAFIDNDFWLRTWSLDDAEGSCKKHFFIPQDWVNMDSLRISMMTQDGRYLCPRGGEVPVVVNGHRLDGIEEE